MIQSDNLTTIEQLPLFNSSTRILSSLTGDTGAGVTSMEVVPPTKKISFLTASSLNVEEKKNGKLRYDENKEESVTLTDRHYWFK